MLRSRARRNLGRVSRLSYAHMIPNGTYNFVGGIAGVDLAYNTLE